LMILIGEPENGSLFNQLLDSSWEGDNELFELSTSKSDLILNEVLTSHIPVIQKRGSLKIWLGAAAAVLLAAIGLFLYLKQAPAKLLVANVDHATNSSKNITAGDGHKSIKLPDGSTVILNSNSSLQFATPFIGKTREVILNGEGYFDIKHDRAHPFIVHTGKIITTVLGTAFDISAYPGQKVIVSVTRGKVSVSDDKNKMLALLTPDQQVYYSQATKVASQQPIIAQKTIEWVKSDMQFTGMPFKELAERLSKRYDVTVEFKNPDLEKYLITGRFNGTESIDDVLKVLCGTSSATYSIDGKTVLLDKNNTQTN
jgi:transmembrane sensor